MEKTFLAVEEALPREAWRQRFLAAWPAMRDWYLKEGLAPRPTVAAERAALERHMPELPPVYERLCMLVGEDEIALGGSFARGRGFSMILVLRYVLGTCRTMEEAVAVLTRIPVPMSQNVTVLDRSGAYATVFVGPDRAPLVTDSRVCTNHQDWPVSPQQEAGMRSGEREGELTRRLADPAAGLPTLVEAMLKPPLYRGCGADGFATVYTAVHRPLQGTVDFVWPGKTWHQGFQRFEPGAYRHDYAIT